jgi:ubiquinone/menaquinone biosynthesis C-methylase UbiE
MLNNPVEYERMAAVEQNHWWYRVLHERVLTYLALKTGGEPTMVSILDVGCGTGGLLLKLQQAGCANILGTDVSEHALKICTERGLNVIQSDVRDLPQQANGQTFDVIICNDVLCYFTMEEILPILEGFKRLLKPGGLLIMNNPAHAAFSGSHDKAVGIVTRFIPKELKRVIGYQLSVINCSQWPFMLSPLVYLVRKFQKKEQSDIDMPPAWLNSLLYSICKLELKLFKSTPWGSSVFIVARKN